MQSLPHAQRGMTLMELLVAGVISIIASGGMLALMVSTLGSGSQTIQMTRLTEDMRATMQIMTGELRRANYHAGFMNCFGHPDCLNSMGITSKIRPISITDNGNSDCFWFWYERPEKTLGTSPVAAFRRTLDNGTVGKIQMTTARTSAPSCGSNSDWVDITDPNIIDVVTFNVSDANSITETINKTGATQNIDRISLSITAKLASGTATTTRELQDFVTVRNNTTSS